MMTIPHQIKNMNKMIEFTLAKIKFKSLKVQ